MLPFGLTNAPSTFMRVMNNLFSDLLDVCVVCFLDDILIFSPNAEEHKKHIELVLDRLRKYHFFAKLKKCEFFKTKVTFLGHDISADGVRVNAAKVASVTEWPAPRDLTEVRSFVGFCQFYNKFIRDFAKIARPLTDLTRKEVGFTWGDE